MKKTIRRIRARFWQSTFGERLAERLSARCDKCPLCVEDRSDFHRTGYIGIYCGIHKGNEAEGCFTPGIIIKAAAWWRNKQERKQIEAENAWYRAQEAAERETED